ncbi:MAG: hypothetical protein K6E99_03345 [Bacilli bacterium]|nr:hypothetical protein [Bacilli bacterium]
MGRDKGILSNKYYKQITELTKLYDSIYKIYQELANLEKKGLKDSTEYKDLVDLLSGCLDIEKRLFTKFDNLDSVEMQDMIFDITSLNGKTEEEMVDKTRLYTTNKIKRLLARLRDYSFLRNDTYDIEETEDTEQEKTFLIHASNGMILQLKLSDFKKLGFTYNEQTEEEQNEEELENIKVTNDAMYYKEKLVNANFYKLLEEEIEKTKSKKYKNELIDYKYNLIYNSISLESAFVNNKDISNNVDLYKGVVYSYESLYPDQYDNVYSSVIESDIEDAIRELKSKVYEGLKANSEEEFEDTIDTLYIKALINSLITENSQQHIREFTNAAKNEARTLPVKANLNSISETIENIINLNTKETNKELKLKH